MKAAMDVHINDDTNAAEKQDATHPVKSILRLEEAADTPALKKRRKEKETEVKPSESANAHSFNSGEAESIEEDVMKEMMEETLEAEISEASGTEERFLRLDENLARYKTKSWNLRGYDEFLEHDDDKDKTEAAPVGEPQVNDRIFVLPSRRQGRFSRRQKRNIWLDP